MDATSVALPDTLAPSLPDGGRGGVAAHLRSLCWTTMFSWTPHRDAHHRRAPRPLLLRPAGAYYAFSTRTIDAHRNRDAHHRRAPRPLLLRPAGAYYAFSTRTIDAHRNRDAHHRRAPRPLLLRPAGAFTTLFLRAPSTRTEIANRTMLGFSPTNSAH
jgi:hypothetical protein